VVEAFRQSGNKPGVDDHRRSAGHPAGACAPWCSWTAAASRPPT
jgi:hypothetical protein